MTAMSDKTNSNTTAKKEEPAWEHKVAMKEMCIRDSSRTASGTGTGTCKNECCSDIIQCSCFGDSGSSDLQCSTSGTDQEPSAYNHR